MATGLRPSRHLLTRLRGDRPAALPGARRLDEAMDVLPETRRFKYLLCFNHVGAVHSVQNHLFLPNILV